MPFPVISDEDFSKGGKDNQKVHDILDYAVTQWESRYMRRHRLEKLYNAHNGILDQTEVDSVVKMTGIKSKTKYVRYRLGRAKLKQLHGEFLEINITPTVSTVNPEAQNQRMSKYKNVLGMALAKPQIETVRKLGYNVFPGMKIPDAGDKSTWSANNFKLENELVMQTLVDDKMINEKLQIQFYYNFVDLTIAAEVFGKNERNMDGVDTYRAVPPKQAMFEENVNDPFLERTPYMGEMRYMYFHEIMASPEFKLDPLQEQQLKDIKDMWELRDWKEGAYEMIDGHPAIPLYTIQWKGLEPVRVWTNKAKHSDVPYRSTISEEYWQKNMEQLLFRDRRHFEETGEHLLDIVNREILWTAQRIGQNIYLPAKKESYLIQRLDDNGKYKVDYDYTGMLFSTVNGFRVSVQEMIYELERIYDEIRYMMNREIRKIRGDAVQYDEAFLPKGKRLIDIIHGISEDGIIRYNSSAEGNQSGLESESDKVGIKSINLGQSQSLVILLGQAMDIERVMDRITGMSQGRMGISKPRQTATANINDIEASRSMTYDLFYFMKAYIEKVLVKLSEKTKLNYMYLGKDSRKFIMDEDQIKYLVNTQNLIWDNYGVTITDGKKEKNILDHIASLFPAEINTGEIRVRDVARFYMQTNFAAALKTLDKAYEEIQKFKEQQSKVSQEADKQQTQTQYQIAKEDRDSEQQHDKDMEVLRTEGKKEIQAMKEGAKAIHNYQNTIGNALSDKSKQSGSNPFE